MGESQKQGFQLLFNRFLRVAFQGSRVTSDGGLILVRELDERLGFMARLLRARPCGGFKDGRQRPVACKVLRQIICKVTAQPTDRPRSRSWSPRPDGCLRRFTWAYWEALREPRRFTRGGEHRIGQSAFRSK